MKLYLFNDHTAAALDDRSGVLTTEPETVGVLTVAGISANVGENPPLVDAADVGICTGRYVTAAGIVYDLPRLRGNIRGVPVSLIEDRAEAMKMRQKLDRVEVALDDLRKSVADLRGIYDKDALWYLKADEATTNTDTSDMTEEVTDGESET